MVMNFKTKPFAHQLQAFELSKDRLFFALLMEQGTGKSKVTLDTIAHLWYEGKINAAVIIAPKGCYLNWKFNEIPAHFPDDIPKRVETWTSSSQQSKTKARNLDNLLKVQLPLLKLLLVNVEALSTDAGAIYLNKFLLAHKPIIVVDESTTIKTITSTRHKVAKKLGKLAIYKRILTGTPVSERPMDLFGQCAFLDSNLLGHPTFLTFKHYYGITKDIPIGYGLRKWGPERGTVGPLTTPKIVAYRRLDQLTKDLDEFSFRVLKQDCLDLPPKVYRTRYVELTSMQRNAYNDMALKMVAEMEDGALSTAPIALTKLMRLQGIVCGHLKMDDGIVRSLESNRIKALKEEIEESSGKVIIWCLFRKDVDNVIAALEEEYPGSTSRYQGGMTEDEREKSLSHFAREGRFFVSTRAGSKGLTLNQSSTNIYYSQDYSLETRQQSEDRNHRIGQGEKVTYTDLIVKGTIDEIIVNTVKEKKSLADLILGNLRAYVRPVEDQEP